MIQLEEVSDRATEEIVFGGVEEGFVTIEECDDCE